MADDWRVKWPEHINAPYPDLPPTLMGRFLIRLARLVRRLNEFLD